MFSVVLTLPLRISDASDQLSPKRFPISQNGDLRHARVQIRSVDRMARNGDAIDIDEQIEAVSKQALDEWVELADAVITNRGAVQLSPKRSTINQTGK
jgi:hypothetical protein